MSSSIEETPDPAQPLELHVPAWSRIVSAAKSFIFGFVLIWVVVSIILQMGAFPNLRNKMRMRLAVGAALPAAALLAARRYLTLAHTLKIDENQLEVIGPLRSMVINPLAVDGLVAVDGLSFSTSEVVVWSKLVLLVDGRKYTLQFEPTTNALAYDLLRTHCVHAWGVPFNGELETPLAGAELSAEEYAQALVYVQRHYLLQTQKGALTGLLMILGSVGVGFVLVTNMAARPNFVKVLIWLGIFAFAGLMVIARSFRQLAVFYKIRNVQRRLRAAA